MSKTLISVRLDKILSDEETTLYKFQGKWYLRLGDEQEIEGDTLDEVVGNYFKATKVSKKKKEVVDG